MTVLLALVSETIDYYTCDKLVISNTCVLRDAYVQIDLENKIVEVFEDKKYMFLPLERIEKITASKLEKASFDTIVSLKDKHTP